MNKIIYINTHHPTIKPAVKSSNCTISGLYSPTYPPDVDQIMSAIHIHFHPHRKKKTTVTASKELYPYK